MGGLAHYLHSHQSTYLHLILPSSSSSSTVGRLDRSIDSTLCLSTKLMMIARPMWCCCGSDPCDPIISTLLLLLLLVSYTDGTDWWETTLGVHAVFDSIIPAATLQVQHGTGFSVFVRFTVRRIGNHVAIANGSTDLSMAGSGDC